MRQRGLLLLLVFFASSAAASTDFSGKKAKTVQAALARPAQGMPVGEKLVFEVSWMGVPIGFGELEVKEKIVLEGKEVYPVVAAARTNDFLSKIYPVRDEVRSWIDAGTLQSFQFSKKVSEGFYQADEKVRYDAVARKGHYESLKNGEKKTFDISVPVHDVVSAFYWVRRQPMTPGRSLTTTVNNGEKDYSLEVDVLSRQTKEMRGGRTADLLLIEPKTRLKGLLEKRGKVWVHLRNEPARTPVLITFKTPFGPIVGVLRGPDASSAG